MTARRPSKADGAWSLPVAVILMAVVMVLQGCETLGAVAAGASKPTARIRGAHLEQLSLDQAVLAFDVEVSNPYAVPLPLVDLDYSLASGGSEFLAGRAELDGSIAAGKAKTVTIPVTVGFSPLLTALADVRPGDVVPYALDATLSVDAPGLGTVALPLRKDGELPIPAVPEVELSSIEWSEISFAEAAAVMNLRVTNPNTFDADLTKLDYGLSLAGAPIVETSLRQGASFPGGGTRDLRIPVSFRPMDLGLSVMRVLGGEGAAYRLAGTMNFDTRFGPVALPFERAGETVFTR